MSEPKKSEQVLVRVTETMKSDLESMATESRRELPDFLRLQFEDMIARDSWRWVTVLVENSPTDNRIDIVDGALVICSIHIGSASPAEIEKAEKIASLICPCIFK